MLVSRLQMGEFRNSRAQLGSPTCFQTVILEAAHAALSTARESHPKRSPSRCRKTSKRPIRFQANASSCSAGQFCHQVARYSHLRPRLRLCCRWSGASHDHMHRAVGPSERGDRFCMPIFEPHKLGGCLFSLCFWIFFWWNFFAPPLAETNELELNF